VQFVGALVALQEEMVRDEDEAVDIDDGITLETVEGGLEVPVVLRLPAKDGTGRARLADELPMARDADLLRHDK
jgi:hypothetical protein